MYKSIVRQWNAKNMMQLGHLKPIAWVGETALGY